jgi:hypothetical protein
VARVWHAARCATRSDATARRMALAFSGPRLGSFLHDLAVQQGRQHRGCERRLPCARLRRPQVVNILTCKVIDSTGSRTTSGLRWPDLLLRIQVGSRSGSACLSAGEPVYRAVRE